ncbi:MAG: hypothetical protein Q7S40_15330 [Opitutaceae bacterium]|nr:hypothetical protein [Opitutaceae bacterium]
MTSLPSPTLPRWVRRCLCAAAGSVLVCVTHGAAQTDGTSGPDMSMSMRQMERVPIFFPPFPPPLDRPVARSVPSAGRLAAPADLAAFINEPFYPQLSTRLYRRSLTDKQKPAVDQYRQTRHAAQVELRAELERWREAGPEERLRALETFARKQTPQLIELEKTAEKLREELHSSGQGWNDLREWHLTDKERRGFSPIELAYVMRAYGYYHAGLAPTQRRLLREIAVELLLAGENTQKAAANNPHVFFQPELSRVAFPADLPAEVGAILATYQTKKSLLKKELFEAVRRQDGAALGFLRSPLRGLVTKQAAALVELETLAERIRVGLAQQPPAPPPATRSPLPAAFTERIVRLLRKRDETERQAVTAVEALRGARRTTAQISYRFDETGLKFVVVPARGRGGSSSPEDAQKIESLRAAMTGIADQYGRKMVELINERDVIRRDAGAALGTTNVATIDAALATANRVAIQTQNEIAYRDYRIAVFQPGLSPEQRRLLFDAAIEELGLPLPPGELQPTRRGSTW